MIPFPTRIEVSPRLAGALALVVALVAGGWYIQSLRTENHELETELQVSRQTQAALEESLSVAGTYEADSTVRNVYRRPDFPVAPDSLWAPPPVDGTVTRSTETTVNPPTDTLRGASQLGRRKNQCLDDTIYVHPVANEGALYTLNGTVSVTPPGREIQYTLGVSVRPFTVRTYRAEDDRGIYRTYVDVPRGFSVTHARSEYVPETPSILPSAVSVMAPLVEGNVQGDLVAGAQITYQRPLWRGLTVWGEVRPVFQRGRETSWSFRPDATLGAGWKW